MEVEIINEIPFIEMQMILLWLFFKLGFTACKAEQSLQGMELQEKEAQKD